MRALPERGLRKAPGERVGQFTPGVEQARGFAQDTAQIRKEAFVFGVAALLENPPASVIKACVKPAQPGRQQSGAPQLTPAAVVQRLEIPGTDAFAGSLLDVGRHGFKVS